MGARRRGCGERRGVTEMYIKDTGVCFLLLKMQLSSVEWVKLPSVGRLKKKEKKKPRCAQFYFQLANNFGFFSPFFSRRKTLTFHLGISVSLPLKKH